MSGRGAIAGEPGLLEVEAARAERGVGVGGTGCEDVTVWK